MQPACLPRSSAEPTSNVSSCPSGGAISGTKPTVDTVVAQPLPAFWYYVLAGGGALLLLVTLTVMVILCGRRYHWAPEKSSSSTVGGGHHHSVMYHSCQQPYQPESYYYLGQNTSCNSNHNCLYPGASASLEPTLVITLEKNDSYGSRCWLDQKHSDCPFKKNLQRHLRWAMGGSSAEVLRLLWPMLDLIKRSVNTVSQWGEQGK